MTDADDGTLRSRWTVEAVGGVTFVTLAVENPSPVARRVRVTNRLDGPVLPPRRRGVPERGWDETGYEGVIDAEDELHLGYACPAAAEDPPATAESAGRPDDSPADATASAVVRELGRARPPADAIPDPAPTVGGASDAPGGRDGDGVDGPDEAGGTHVVDEPMEVDGRRDAGRGRATACAVDQPTVDPPTADPPGPVTSWLAAVERRVERGEQLTGASVPEATAALSEAGGLDAVADLPPRLAADAEALRAVADRAERLADRADAAEVPVGALRRLA